jgi:hypothetical protein
LVPNMAIIKITPLWSNWRMAKHCLMFRSLWWMGSKTHSPHLHPRN